MQKFEVHGKWILAGEHAVLRGCPALVFPVQSRQLTLEYQESSNDFTVEFDNDDPVLQQAFWSVFNKALEKLSIKPLDIRGEMSIKNNVPIGAGMGASATLCVALGRWLASLGRISESAVYELAKSLEDIFHGKSSGVDVAIALRNKPLLFHYSGEVNPLELSWQPHIYLSYSGKKGVTSECVKKVNALIEANPQLGSEIDEEMKRSVQLAKLSLERAEDIEGLANALTRARNCFDRWGLVSKELKGHMTELESLGAIATKPTGSGDGGYVLSLWREPAPLQRIPFEMIKA